MCLITFAWQAHPDYPLIVAANRDEWFARPAKALHAWPNSTIIAGQDVQAGGTWLGITPARRFAALTNIRRPAADKQLGKASRGQIVVDFLTASVSAVDFANALDVARFEAFNLLLCDGEQLLHLNSQSGRAQLVEPGIHGLSNASLNTAWPKVERAKQSLRHAIASKDSAELRSRCFRFLNNTEIAPDARLPSTGVSLDWERSLSASFINTPDYGTRVSTFLLAGQSSARIEEHCHDNGSQNQLTCEWKTP
jgi:uncharacterized protein with NRDE domain